jgi:hypothetical protein
MSKHRTFKQFYEDITVSDALGGSPGSTDSISGSDFYAPGDSRVPKLLGITSRRGKVGRKSKRKHKNKTK